MKTKILPDLLTAAFLAFLLAFGGIRCITTAFDLEISLKILILSCLVFAMAGCLLFTRPRGGWTVLALLAVLGIYLWRKTTLTDQLLQLTYRITKHTGIHIMLYQICGNHNIPDINCCI